MYRPDSIEGGPLERLDACCNGEQIEEVPPYKETSRLIGGTIQVVVTFADTDEGRDSLLDFLAGCNMEVAGQRPVQKRALTDVEPEDARLEDSQAYAGYVYGFDNPTAAHLISMGAREREMLGAEALDGATVIELPVDRVQQVDVEELQVVASAMAGG